MKKTQLYYKSGRRYVPAGISCGSGVEAAFYCHGLWWIGASSATLLYSAKEFPRVPALAVPYRTHADALAKVLLKWRDDMPGGRASLYELAQKACEYFAEVVEAKAPEAKEER